ncbi:MAG: hypothetical protein R3D46_11855 [Defluviimonas denitrificans]
MPARIAPTPRFAASRPLPAFAGGLAVLAVFALAATLPRPAPGPDAPEDWHGNVAASHWHPVTPR